MSQMKFDAASVLGKYSLHELRPFIGIGHDRKPLMTISDKDTAPYTVPYKEVPDIGPAVINRDQWIGIEIEA